MTYTLDTGMLIALERRRQRALEIYAHANEHGHTMTVPTAVVGEWWRGRTDARDRILRFVVVEPLTTALAKLAGEALARTSGASLVDAIVMASAAIRGDAVLTSDVGDLVRLSSIFPNVRVMQA
jgi:predicted nucleic acid-binding protein